LQPFGIAQYRKILSFRARSRALLEVTEPGGPPGRIAAIDVARGLALLGMGVYHLSWDLAYFGFAPPGLPYSPGIRVYSHIVACAFLALVGVSLAVAHRDGPRWPAFVRRLAIVAGAAALVSIATLLAAPDETIWFGILHCIAAASLLAAPFLRAPAWAPLVAGAVALAAPRVLAGAAFNPPALVWLGLGTEDPTTLDWRPLLPWAGVPLICLGLTRLALPQLLASKLARWRPGPPGRALAFAGRHSLAIYLIHQPILFGLLFVGAHLSGEAARHDRERYIAACRPACVESGGEIEACAQACECVAAAAEKTGLLASLTSHSVSDESRARVSGIVGECSSDAR
jgi:uncharacterized membrane protein